MNARTATIRGDWSIPSSKYGLPSPKMRGWLRKFSAFSALFLMTAAGPIVSGQDNIDPTSKQAVANRLIAQSAAKYSEGHFEDSIALSEQALVIFRASGFRPGEALSLNYLGLASFALGRYLKATTFQSDFLSIAREIQDREGEAVALNNLAQSYKALGDLDRARDLYESSLVIMRGRGLQEGQVDSLVGLSGVYLSLSHYARAAEVLEQARAIQRTIGDRKGEALSLRLIGTAYKATNQYSRAIEVYEQSLGISRGIGDLDGEAISLNNLGSVYLSLAQYARAAGVFAQALTVSRKVGDRALEASVLNNMGNLSIALGHHLQAIRFYGEALDLFRATGNRKDELTTLNNLGVLFQNLHEESKALEFLEGGLEVARAIGDRTAEGRSLNNIGVSYYSLRQYPRAIVLLEQALAIQREIGAREEEAKSLYNLGQVHHALGHPGAAALFLKQAVNGFQAIRGDNSSLSKEFQSSYTDSVSSAYRTLADVLVESGRLGEAERVMTMLKEREYFEYTLRDESADPRRTTIGYSADEAAWQERYAQIGTQLVTLGEEFQILARVDPRTPAQQARYEQLSKDMDVARRGFETSLAEITAAFSAQSADRAKAYGSLNLDNAETLQGTLERLPEGTVVVHYLVLPEKVHILFTSRTAQLHREASVGGKPLTEAALNRLVAGFREVLKDPSRDPRAAGKALYDALVAPIADDLRQSGARTVMLSLDGALRLVPFAALWDGEGYLVQRYGLAVYTAASTARLADAPKPAWTVAAMGVSKAEAGFAPLPAVPLELGAIVREGGQAGGGEGILGGTVRLDERFTAQEFAAALSTRPPVVHIASHFSFSPGATEADSFLLLGGGGRLTLSDFRMSGGYKMVGVDLLTLSACETALSDAAGSRQGREVEGFGALAQSRGAAAVIATLWSVADGSTGLFMREFYRTREAEHLDKAESMRRVQLGFISGALRPGTAPPSLRGAMRAVDPAKAKIAAVERFKTSPDAPFAHPFYWAPFIIMGNWL